MLFSTRQNPLQLIKTLKISSLFSILFLIVSLVQLSTTPAVTMASPFRWGILDAQKEFTTNKNFSIEHTFTVWGDKHKPDIDKAILSSNKNSRDLLLTIEPWQLQNETNGGHLFYNIIKGYYNNTIKSLCSNINATAKTQVILRWGHEMELYTTSRYPWSTPYPQSFQNSYRTWVETCRSVAPNIKFMWSPGGNVGAEKYYPGDKYVDYVGFSAYSYPEYEMYWYKKTLSIDYIIADRYNRLERFKKPMLAAEFGIAGDDATKKNNFKEIQRIAMSGKYPLMQGVIIFNYKDVSWLPGKIPDPNFYTHNSIINAFIRSN
jgi:endoglucanase